MTRRAIFIPLVLWLLAALPLADAGVLIPTSEKNLPDPARLSLEDMQVRIDVDHLMVTIRVRQIYRSHVGKLLEGTYVFSFPAGAGLSDFAVWDGVTRIPGVILEKKKAAEVYKDLASQAIDPGLLQMGESEEASEIPAGSFTVKVAPIPPYGFKRVELEYRQKLELSGGKARLVLPLRNQRFQPQTAGRMDVELRMQDGRAPSAVTLAGKAYPVKIRKEGEQTVASWTGKGVTFSEDLIFEWSYDTSAPRSSFLPHRVKAETADPDGYFLLEHILPSAPAGGTRPPVAVTAVVDASLSMWWDKIGQADLALRSVLDALKPEDKLQVVLFSDRIRALFPAPVPASLENRKAAVDGFHAATLSGGTEPGPAIEEGIRQLKTVNGANRFLILVGDFVPTTGKGRNSSLIKDLSSRLTTAGVRVVGVGTGDDANLPLLNALAQATGGEVLALGGRDQVEPEVQALAGRIGREPFRNLGIKGPAAFRDVYPAHPVSVFAASSASWTGRYRPAPGDHSVSLSGTTPAGKPYSQTLSVTLPEECAAHAQVPRIWARARVDFLLDRINREGEDRAAIEEIIALSRRYRFVTPYTSFLAAPRGLLRPRVIQPMDPVIRIQADPSIVSASVLLPWGETLPMKPLSGNLWQARFVAPGDLAEGTHSCTVILRDRSGGLFREAKTFVLDGSPPVCRWLDPVTTVRVGSELHLRVAASADTRTLVANLGGVDRTVLRWNPSSNCCTGVLRVPPGLPWGPLRLTLMAEDLARNVYRKDYEVRVIQ